MAMPELAAYTQALFDYAGNRIAKLIRERIPPNLWIMDVGAGWAKYGTLLPEYQMDALEIWRPYAQKHKLDARYANVYIEDAADHVWQRTYGATIFGDVLEHLSVERAQTAITNACNHSSIVAVAVPFEMPQHEVDGNPHEAHVQEDLNEELMAQRYPQLEFYHSFGRPKEHTKAIYVKKGCL